MGRDMGMGMRAWHARADGADESAVALLMCGRLGLRLHAPAHILTADMRTSMRMYLVQVWLLQGR